MGKGILELEYIKKVVVENAKKYPDILSIMLIGSYAKGEATPESDVDLIIEFDLEDYDADTYFDLIDILEESLDKKIDLLTKLGVEKSSLKDSLLKGGRMLYVKS